MLSILDLYFGWATVPSSNVDNLLISAKSPYFIPTILLYLAYVLLSAIKQTFPSSCISILVCKTMNCDLKAYHFLSISTEHI